MSRAAKQISIFDVEPEDLSVMIGLSAEYISLKDYKNAEIYLKRIIERDSNYIAAYIQYAQLSDMLNKRDDAVSLYRCGIEAAKRIGDSYSVKEMEELLNELK